MKIIIVFAALIVFVVSVIIGFRQPITLIPLGALFILSLNYSDKMGKVITSLVIILGCFAILIYWNSMTPLWGGSYERYKSLEEIKQKGRDQELNQLGVIISAKNVVKNNLKDSDSARFSGDFVAASGAVCGYVNAKNSYGSYTGNTRYTYFSGFSAVDDGSPEFSKSWRDICAK